MQNRPMHHDSIFPNVNTVGTGMQINTLVEVSAVPQMDVIGKSQARAVLNRSPPIHLEDQAVKNPPQAHSDGRGDPAEQSKQRLFKQIERKKRSGYPPRIPQAIEFSTLRPIDRRRYRLSIRSVHLARSQLATLPGIE